MSFNCKNYDIILPCYYYATLKAGQIINQVNINILQKMMGMRFKKGLLEAKLKCSRSS